MLKVAEIWKTHLGTFLQLHRFDFTVQCLRRVSSNIVRNPTPQSVSTVKTFPKHHLTHSLTPHPAKLSNMYALKGPASHRLRSHQSSTLFKRMTSFSLSATIKSLDHLVLTVKSISKTTEWYTRNLGMRSECFVSTATPEIIRYSLIFGEQKMNLHELGKVHFSHLFHPYEILCVWLNYSNQEFEPKPSASKKEVQISASS